MRFSTWLEEFVSKSNTIQAQEGITQPGKIAGKTRAKLCISRSCRARFPADHGRLDAAVESRQLNRILACLAALARLGVTPRFARPKHLASLGRVTALPRFARPGLALQVVKLCGCRIRGITCPAASKMRGRLTRDLPSSRLLFAFGVLSEWRPGLATTC